MATKLRKIDEITRQYVMNEMDNLMFKAIMQSTSQINHKSLESRPPQNMILKSNYLRQAYSFPSQLSALNYVQQPFLSPSQCSTFSHTSQPLSSSLSTPSHHNSIQLNRNIYEND